MANKTILDLPGAGPLNGTEVVPGDQGGATVHFTTQDIGNLAPVQNHNSLTNLTVGDPHPQYLNQFRGDSLYPPITRIVATGSGLQGGGDLSANRTLVVQATATRGITVTVNGVELDILGMGVLPEAVDSANDKLILWNNSETRPRFVSVATALAGASGFVPIARAIVSGAGLTGGGDLSVDRTLAVGAGTGITVNADDVALNLAHASNVDHSAVSISTTTGLTGGGNLTATRTLSLDVTHTRNTDHAAVSISGANSIAGGGDITASRSLALVNDSAAPGNSTRYGTGPTGTKGWFTTAFSDILGSIGNGQVPVGAVTQWQASLSIAWGQISGSKNADLLQGIAASSFVQINSSPQLAALGVGTAAGAAGSIRATGDVTAFFSSDARIKENVVTLTNCLYKIKQIRGVSYDLTEDRLKQEGGPDGYFVRKSNIGLIAQEVQKVFPEVVGKRPDGLLAVDYAKLVAPLLEAIVELSREVDELKRRLP